MLNTPAGIVTALHGVVGCPSITARQGAGDIGTFRGLVVAAVDIAHDAALLTSPDLPNGTGLEATGELPAGATTVFVLGHPSNVPGLHEMQLSVPSIAVRSLGDLVPPELFIPLQRRSSPSVTSRVLSINGNLQPGHSGAPIIDRFGHVLAIASGGLAGGTLGIGWAIPIVDVRWTGVGLADLVGLSKRSPTLVFAADPSSSDARETEIQAKLATARKACAEGDLPRAKSIFLEIISLRPDDPGVVEYQQACEAVVLEPREIEIGLLVRESVWKYRDRNSTYTAHLALRLDDSYCGSLSSRHGPDFKTCRIPAGDHSYRLDDIRVYDYDGNLDGGGSCGGYVRITPTQNRYGIVMCVKKRDIKCQIMSMDRVQVFRYEECPF